MIVRPPLAVAVAMFAGLQLFGASVVFAQIPAAPNVLDTPPATTEGGRAPPSPQMLAARRAMREACGEDIRSFCADVDKGRGGVMRCLRTHAAQISPTCKAAGQALRDARRAPVG